MKKRAVVSSILIAFIIIIFGGGYYFLQLHNKAKVVEATLPFVKLSTIHYSHIPDSVNANGNLVAKQKVNISAETSGYIQKIFYQEGQHVKTGDVLIQLDNRTEKNKVASAKADAQFTHLTYQRTLKIFNEKLTSPQILDKAQDANLKNQATLKTEQTNLAEKTLTAPFSGFIGAKKVSVGEYISAGQSVVTLVDSQHLRVEYTLPSRYVSQIKLGQTVYVHSNENPQKKFSAKVTYIAPMIDSTTQTISVHAYLNNTLNELKPGAFVHVTQILGPAKTALLAPSPSVFATLKGHYIFSVKNNKIIKMPVTVGERENGFVEIIKGLHSGDHIITAGQNQVKTGQKVKVYIDNKAAQ